MIRRTDHEIEEVEDELRAAYLHHTNLMSEEFSESSISITDEDVGIKVENPSAPKSNLFKTISTFGPHKTHDEKVVPDKELDASNISKSNSMPCRMVIVAVMSIVCIACTLAAIFFTSDLSGMTWSFLHNLDNATMQLNPKIINQGSQSFLERQGKDNLPSDYFEKPKIVDLLGTPSFLQVVFSECFDKGSMNKKEKIELLTETSFCERPFKFNQNHQEDIFLAIRNPLARTAQSFIEKQNRKSSKYDKNVAQMNIVDYIKSSVHDHNFLTRVLTCNFQGTLNSSDVQHAKEIIGTKNIAVEIFPNLKGLMNYLQKHFSSHVSPQIFECIDHRLQNAWLSGVENQIRLLLSDNSKILREVNEFDMQLFMHILDMDIKDS